MAIGNAFKAMANATKTTANATKKAAPAFLTGAGIAAAATTIADNVTTPVNPNIFVISQTPTTGEGSAAYEGTWAYLDELMRMNGTGYTGKAGLGGDDIDSPRVTTTKGNNTRFPITAVLIIGAVIIGVVLLLSKKKKKGRK